MRLNAACMTCGGNTRENNQDAVVLRAAEQRGQCFAVLAVCDGVGGLERGELASTLAVRRIGEWYDSVMRWLKVETADPELLKAHLKDLAEECNTLVRDYQVANQIHTGTTMSLLMIIKEFYYIVQVGDSRVYRYREEHLEQMTLDASVTKIKDGKRKLYLDNYLGKQEPLWFTSASGEIQRGDLFLVCSDGLYHYLQPQDIQRIGKNVRRAGKIKDACGYLIHQMMERGEKDNITVGLIYAK